MTSAADFCRIAPTLQRTPEQRDAEFIGSLHKLCASYYQPDRVYGEYSSNTPKYQRTPEEAARHKEKIRKEMETCTAACCKPKEK